MSRPTATTRSTVRESIDNTDPPRPKVVIGVHGIFSAGNWVTKLRSELGHEADVVHVHYTLAGLVQLWFPWMFRRFAVATVRRKLQEYRNRYNTHDIIVIAHSFGTYLTCEAIKEGAFSIDRLILCGCILPLDYPFHALYGKVKHGIINEVASEDIWPPFAQCFSWGYGDTGTQGAGSAFVVDRFHDGGHSRFFEKEFIQKYWKPLLSREAPRADGESQPPRWWMLFVTWIPLKYAILVSVLWLILLGGRFLHRHIHHYPIGSRLTDGFFEISHFTGGSDSSTNVESNDVLSFRQNKSLTDALPRELVKRIAESYLTEADSSDKCVVIGRHEFRDRTSSFAFQIDMPGRYKQVRSNAVIIRRSQGERIQWYDWILGIERLWGVFDRRGSSILPLWVTQSSDSEAPIGFTVDTERGDELWIMMVVRTSRESGASPEDFRNSRIVVKSWPTDVK